MPKLTRSTQKKENSITPRPYLSWSQLTLFEENPKEYRKIYLEGGKRYDSAEMKLGRKVARILENKEMSDNPFLENAKMFVPQYRCHEYEFTTALGKIPLLGRFDLYNPRKKIGEVKTGKAYTQAMADDLGQLTFYSLMFYLKHKKLPELELYWIPTQWNDGELDVIGEVRGFKTWRDLEDIMDMGQRVEKAWKGIIKLTEETLKI